MKKAISAVLTLVLMLSLVSVSFADESSEDPAGKVTPRINVYTGFASDIPFGTTVGEIKTSLGDSVSVTRDGIELANGDTVLCGDKIVKSGVGGYSVTAAFMGDVNGDGKLDISDVISVLQLSADWKDVKIVDLAVADADGNGMVNISDVILLLKKIAGWNIALADEPVKQDAKPVGLTRTTLTYKGTGLGAAQNLCHGEQVGCKFTVAEGERAISYNIVIESWNNNGYATHGVFSASLYLWDTDYDTTVAGKPIYTETVKDVNSGETFRFSLCDSAGNGLGAGTYMIVLHDGDDSYDFAGSPRGIGTWLYDALPSESGIEYFYKEINRGNGTNKPVVKWDKALQTSLVTAAEKK